MRSVELGISSPSMESSPRPRPTWFQAFMHWSPGESLAGKGAGTVSGTLDGQDLLWPGTAWPRLSLYIQERRTSFDNSCLRETPTLHLAVASHRSLLLSQD